MKKNVALFMAILLMIPCVSRADSTDRCGLIEFIELFTKRITEYQNKNNVDFRLLPGSISDPTSNDGWIVLESTAGSIAVHPDDYTIHHILITYAVSQDEKQKYDIRLICAAAAISALEINAIGESQYKAIGGTALDAGQIIVNDIIGDRFQDCVVESLNSKSRVKVYEGNYYYFIDTKMINDVLFVFLIAEEHE